MSDFVEVDVRGLSCPEPVLMVMVHSLLRVRVGQAPGAL